MKGQGTTELVLILVAVLVAAAIGAYYLANLPPSTERDYITIEGKIVEVKTGDRLVLIWENDDGTFAIRFSYTSEVLPIGQNIKLTYYHTSYGSRIIENVGWLW